MSEAKRKQTYFEEYEEKVIFSIKDIIDKKFEKHGEVEKSVVYEWINRVFECTKNYFERLEKDIEQNEKIFVDQEQTIKRLSDEIQQVREEKIILLTKSIEIEGNSEKALKSYTSDLEELDSKLSKYEKYVNAVKYIVNAKIDD